MQAGVGPAPPRPHPHPDVRGLLVSVRPEAGALICLGVDSLCSPDLVLPETLLPSVSTPQTAEPEGGSGRCPPEILCPPPTVSQLTAATFLPAETESLAVALVTELFS